MRVALLAASNGPPLSRLNNLQFVHEDADRVRKAFGGPLAGYDYIEVVGREKAARDVLAQFEKLASETRPGDVLSFYFSGHGHVSRQQLFLLWEDTDLSRPVTTALPVSQLKSVFANARAHSKLMILDCCRSGAAGEAVFGKAGPSEESFREPLYEAAREGASIIIAACSKNAITREIPELGSGYLTHLLVSALTERFHEADRDGDGLLSISDFMQFCNDQTAEFNRSNATREPLEYPESYGELRGNVYLTFHRNPALRSEASVLLDLVKRTLKLSDLSDSEQLKQAQIARFRQFLETLSQTAGDQLASFRSLALDHGTTLLLAEDVSSSEFETYLAKRRFEEPLALEPTPTLLVRQSVALLCSASAKAVSFESEAIEGGVFSRRFCDALTGKAADDDGFVTVQSAFDYIRSKEAGRGGFEQAPELFVNDYCARETILSASHFRRNPQRIAILVGTNSFVDTDIPRLRYSEDDVARAADILSTKGHFECFVLTGSDARFSRISGCLRSIAENCTPDAVILFYFTGHGFVHPDVGLQIIPYDGAIVADRYVAFSVCDIFSTIRNSVARRVVYVFDTSFSGAAGALLPPAEYPPFNRREE